ncbi:MAG: SMR family transporter [Nitrospirota bacterium]
MSPFFLHIAIIAVLDIAASITAKYYSITKHPLLLVATFIILGSAGVVFAKSLKYEGVAIANVLWIVVSIIGVTLIGYLYFKESITGIQMAGIVVITLGLVMVNLK